MPLKGAKNSKEVSSDPRVGRLERWWGTLAGSSHEACLRACERNEAVLYGAVDRRVGLSPV